jgi:purine-nucleoside phosphorylase
LILAYAWEQIIYTMLGVLLILNYETIIKGMQRFGSTEKDICTHGIGVLSEQIHENVILAPWWEPSALPGLGEAEYLSESGFSSVKVWNIVSEKGEITYIKTGIGAPVLMDVLLSLGVTKCQKVIFIGSVGSLDTDISIGDIVIPEFSVCGDGASRYIASDNLIRDCFGEKAYPDSKLLSRIEAVTEKVCSQNNVRWHLGRNFSIDTIVAQFAHIDLILDMNCNVIEMETAAAFRAAKMANIQIIAIFSVSDNTVVKKSLICGRTDQEMDYRRFVRRSLFPKIIIETFQAN